MREIKFRAWDEDKKEMAFFDFLMTDDVKRFGEAKWFLKDLMQFTGLHDKNGKEIYEASDVVKHNDKNIILIHTTKFGLVGVVINKNFGNILNDRILMNTHHYVKYNFFVRTQKYLEVIGNIHEHPELITSLTK